MNLTRLCPSVFVLLLISCKPAQESPPKATESATTNQTQTASERVINFCEFIVHAEVSYNQSRAAIGNRLRAAIERGDSETMLGEVLKSADMSAVSSDALKAVQYLNSADKELNFIEATSELKDVFSKLRKVMTDNYDFVDNASQGKLIFVQRWIDGIKPANELIADLDVEMGKLVKKTKTY